MAKKKDSYEESMKKLEDIAEKIERGDMGLDMMIKLFEQGMELVKECQEFLSAAELRINKLVGDSGSETEEFLPEQ